MIQRIYASTFMLEKKMTRAGPTASCGYTQPYTHTKRATLIFAAAARESIRHGGELHCVAKHARNPSTHQEAGNISGMVKSAQLKSVTSDSHKRADQFFFFFFFLSKAFSGFPQPARVRTPARTEFRGEMQQPTLLAV